jgi:hypothetical protein
MEQFDRAVEQGRRQVMNRQISMLHELQGIGLNVFSHLSAATKLWADVSIKMITEVMLAIMQKDLQEQIGTDARDPFVSHNGVD